MRGGKRKKPPWSASRSGSKKGRTTPLYFEGLKFTRFGGFVNLSMKLPETSTLPTTGKRVVNAKKRSFQPEKSGENSAYAHKKSWFCHFWEKASMENHFGFCALKSPQTRMNIDKNGVGI